MGNINTRYEVGNFNLQLRHNYLKIYCINSVVNLTLPVFYLGSTCNTLQNICEGNHVICQEIPLVKFPLFLSNFETTKSNKIFNFLDFYTIFSKYFINIFFKKYNCFNILCSTIGLTGLNILAYKFDNFSVNDLNNFNILYLLNLKYNYLNKNFNKHLELKLLYYNKKLSQIIIEQNFLIN